MRVQFKKLSKIFFLALCATLLPNQAFATGEISISLDGCNLGKGDNYAENRTLSEGTGVSCSLENDILTIEPFSFAEEGEVFRASFTLKNESENSYRISDFTPQNTTNLVTALSYWQDSTLAADFDQILDPNETILATFDIIYANQSTSTSHVEEAIAFNLSFTQIEAAPAPTRAPQSNTQTNDPAGSTETTTVVAQASSNDQPESIPNISGNPATDDSFMPVAVFISCALILVVVLNRRLNLKQKSFILALALIASSALPSHFAAATSTFELIIQFRTANNDRFIIALEPVKEETVAIEPEHIELPGEESKKPEEQPTDEPIEGPSEELEQPIEEPERELIDEPNNQPEQEPVDGPEAQLAEEPNDEPKDQPAEEPTTEAPNEQPAETQPTEETKEQPTEEPTERPTEETSNTSEVPTEPQTEEPKEEQPAQTIESHINDGAIENPIQTNPEPTETAEAQPTRTKGGYPYQNRCPQDKDAEFDNNGMYICECVSYAAWRVQDAYGYMPNFRGRGNANQWATTARSYGITVSNTPKVGSVGVSYASSFGHVVWVEKVEGDQVYISHYNSREKETNYQAGEYSEKWTAASNFEYIYFDEIQK